MTVPSDPSGGSGGAAGSELTVDLPTAADCRRLGELVASLLRAGDLVVLAGPLGAGKTVLAQGIGAGLGVAGAVTSPTFVIARTHHGGRLPMVHVDAYRLGGVEEVDDLDLDTDLTDSVLVVEWGEGLVEQLAAERLEIRLDRGAVPAPDGTHQFVEGAEGPRTATLVAVGPSWRERLAVLAPA